jgi:hypothetical protein
MLTKENQIVALPLEKHPSESKVELVYYPIPLTFAFSDE